MNPLRALGDLIAGRPVLYVHPLDDEPAVGLPDWGERERLMRHTGRPECPIAEHSHALQELGHVMRERDEARAEADLWMRRALRAEAQLRHPCTGQPEAA